MQTDVLRKNAQQDKTWKVNELEGIMVNKWVCLSVHLHSRVKKNRCPPQCPSSPHRTRSPKDRTDAFNLSKTDLNVFLLPHTVCGRQHGLQEPEERGPRLLKEKRSSGQLQGHQVQPDLQMPPRRSEPTA